MSLDLDHQMALRLGGVIRAPLFETPYVVPPQFNGADVFFDSASAEPIIQTKIDGKHIAMLPQPQDYGLNVYGGPDAPTSVPYHGDISYAVSTVDSVANYRTGYNVRYGNLYNVGWRAGLPPFSRNPAGIDTRKLQGPTNYPDDAQAACPKGWPSWNAIVQEPLSSAYGDIQVTGPMPTFVRTMPTQFLGQNDTFPAGQFYTTHKGAKTRLSIMASNYGVAETAVGTEFGTLLDNQGIYINLLRGVGTNGGFYIYVGRWVNPYSFWLGGSTQTLNARGLMVGSNAARGPSFLPYERTVQCPRGMYLRAWANIAGPTVPLGAPGTGVATYTDGQGASPVSPYPIELVIADDDELQAAFRNTAPDNGRLHTVIAGLQRFPGQALTPIVIDASEGVYYPVQFMPKSDKARTAIATGGYLNRWSLKLSGAGYFMLINNAHGIQGQLFHTQGMSLDYQPRHAVPGLVSLPCFNPCIPALAI